MEQRTADTSDTDLKSGKTGRFPRLRQFGVFLLLFVSAILFFCAVNIGASLIPVNETWKKNAAESCRFQKERGYYPKSGLATLDNYTDVLILNIAFAMDSQHPVDSGMLGRYYLGEKDKDCLNSMKELIENGSDKMVPVNYSRYWHGQSPYIRLLHFLFTLPQIYAMNGIVTLFLAMVAFALVLRRCGKVSAFALFALIALCAFQTFSLSLQYCPAMWVGLVSLISMLIIPNRRTWKYMFFLTGMCCAHLDLLTAPMLTLGIPAIFLCADESRSADGGRGWHAFFNWLRIWIGYPMLWLAGYASCWGTKVFLGGLTEGSWEGARRQFAFRLSLSYGEHVYTRWGALWHNTEMLVTQNLFFLYIFAAVFLVLLAVGIVRLCKGRAFFDWNLFPGYLVLACMPAVLVMTMANHTEIHTYFTYRGLSVSFAALFLIVTAFRKKQPMPSNIEH